MVDQVLTAWMMLAERKAEEVEEGSGERWLGVIRDLFGRGGKRGSRGTGEAEVYFGNQVFYVVGWGMGGGVGEELESGGMRYSAV